MQSNPGKIEMTCILPNRVYFDISTDRIHVTGFLVLRFVFVFAGLVYKLNKWTQRKTQQGKQCLFNTKWWLFLVFALIFMLNTEH